jgi:hypothetical protein
MKNNQIKCAICNKPVERVAWFDEFETGMLVIEAYCHGEKDVMRIDLKKIDLSTLKALEYTDGVAFSTKRLTA